MSAKLEGIRTCVFDAYGTLFDVHSPIHKLSPGVGPKAQELSLLWRQKQLEYTWLRSLMGVHADFWKVTGEALDYALGRHGIDDQGLKDALMALYLKLDAYDDARAALAAVRARGLRTAILSNGSPAMLDAAVRSAGLDALFDAVFSVEDVGIYKPSRRVYRHAMHKLGLIDAAAVCFVSANTWDAQAAAQFGFQAVRIDRFSLPDERIPGAPALTLKTLAELPEAIG